MFLLDTGVDTLHLDITSMLHPDIGDHLSCGLDKFAFGVGGFGANLLPANQIIRPGLYLFRQVSNPAILLGSLTNCGVTNAMLSRYFADGHHSDPVSRFDGTCLGCHVFVSRGRQPIETLFTTQHRRKHVH